MNKNLEKWIDECVKKGTFRNREDAIEWCVGATKVFCECFEINQKDLNDINELLKEPLKVPLKWDDNVEKNLKKMHNAMMNIMVSLP